MDDTIGKAAKALYESIDDNQCDDETDFNIELFRDEARTMVRAAIATLTDPSDEMVAAFYDAVYPLDETRNPELMRAYRRGLSAAMGSLLVETEKSDG